MRIGPYTLSHPVIAAPMAGVTDRPFRQLVKRLGVELAVSEMVTSNPTLYSSDKTVRRGDHRGEPGLIAVQIAGGEPEMLANAARYNVARGAQIIDINMGCPAKKVCKLAAGSALMQDEALVEQILQRVVRAVDVPVTLKIRTGWSRDHKNALTIARLAESAGIQALTIHGRTKACGYSGDAEYDTIRAVKQSISIPVIANGDITSPEKARDVLAYTGADAVMVGRAAQGNPWLFREIQHFLDHDTHLPQPSLADFKTVMTSHLVDLYHFYGEFKGCRIARKHIGWYTQHLPGATAFRQSMNQAESTATQMHAVERFLLTLGPEVNRLGLAA